MNANVMPWFFWEFIELFFSWKIPLFLENLTVPFQSPGLDETDNGDDKKVSQKKSERNTQMPGCRYVGRLKRI